MKSKLKAVCSSSGPQVAGEPVDVLEPDLADQDAVPGIGVSDGRQRPVDVVELVAIVERMGAGHRVVRDLGQRRVLDQQGGRIDPHAGGAPVEPEAQDRLVLGPDVRVVPVQVRLLGVNRCRYHSPGVPSGFVVRVQVLPPRNSEGQPVGGSSPSGRARAEPEPLALRGAGTGRERRLEPGWRSETWFGTMSTIVRMPSARALRR